MGYRLTQLALDDLEAISSYLGQRNPAATERLLDEIYNRLQLLSTQPGLGGRRDELLPGLRCSVVGRYVIFYQRVDQHIDVLRIVHGSQDLDAIQFE